MNVQLQAITPQPLGTIYRAYRLCYSKGQPTLPTTERGNVDYDKICDFVKKLLVKGHVSPLEHVSITFYIEGVSRALTHQLVRHRTGKYSQQSQRYVNANNFDYVIPPAIKKDTNLSNFYIENMLKQQATYNDLVVNLIRNNILSLNIEVPKDLDIKGNILYLISWFKTNYKSTYKAFEKEAMEDARYVLPNATTSCITVTMDLNNFRKFYALRSCKHAQWEIRELAEEMMKQVKEHVPFADYHAKNCGITCNECAERGEH